MRVIVCGSRTWLDKNPIYDFLRVLPAGSVIVHGAARGADQIADSAARSLGLAVEPHPADWERLGRAAGPARNQKMADAGADALFAFRQQGESPGTDDMIRRAKAAGIPSYIVRQGDALEGLRRGDIHALGHQVNLRGVMGAGIAKQIRSQWPVAYSSYRAAIAKRKLILGGILAVPVLDNPTRYVVHLAGQQDFGTATPQTDYDALFNALARFAQFALASNLRPGLPYGIGCGLAGGTWTIVLQAILRAFQPTGVTLYKIA